LTLGAYDATGAVMKIEDNTASTGNLLDVVKQTSTKVVINSSGYLGIGDTTPEAKLKVVSAANTDGGSNNYAVFGAVTTSASNLYGGYFTASGGATDSYNVGVYGGATTAGAATTSNRGVSAYATGATTNYAVYADAVSNDTSHFGIYSATGYNYFASRVGINTASPGYILTVNGEPGANGYTAFTNYSDARLKTNITALGTGYLSKIMDLNPSTFNYNELTGYDEATRSRTITGFIAQDLQAIFPEMVGSTIINGVEYLDTNLSNLPLYMIKAIQEQQTEIQTNQANISTLQNSLSLLDSRISGDMVVNGSLNVSGQSTLANLTVTGTTTVQQLAVAGTATINILKVTGLAEFGGDISLAATVNTKQAITKKFIASGSIAAGSVVIIDPTKDGYVTTTTNAADTKIIGVAIDEAINAGDEIKVAIGGSVQVSVGQFTAVASGDMIVSDAVAGKAKADAAPKVGSILGKATSAKDVNNYVWVLITLQ